MIILTVPHSHPSNIIKNRSYDLLAEKFAKLLQEKKQEIFIIKSGQNRHDILDDNRYSKNGYSIKKDSTLWNTLREKLNCSKNNLVLDIHSFPNKSFNNCFQLNSDCEIVLLDYTPYQEITKKIFETLKKNNINSKITEGKIGSNSILDVLTLHPCYVPTVLIEVNESLSTNRLNDIAKIISDII
jgi:hypothetical protein